MQLLSPKGPQPAFANASQSCDGTKIRRFKLHPNSREINFDPVCVSCQQCCCRWKRATAIICPPLARFLKDISRKESPLPTFSLSSSHLSTLHNFPAQRDPTFPPPPQILTAMAPLEDSGRGRGAGKKGCRDILLGVPLLRCPFHRPCSGSSEEGSSFQVHQCYTFSSTVWSFRLFVLKPGRLKTSVTRPTCP